MESKNDFNEAKRLIDNIRIDMDEHQVSKKVKKVFNDLNKLIIDISNNKIKEKDAVKRLEKNMSGLTQLRQE